MLVQNLTKKCDQSIVNASRLFNNIEKNYMMTKKEAFAMVYALHKFRHYLLCNKFIFYVDHMGLLYLLQKPQVSRKITRWLLLFLEYDFSIIYKPRRFHFVADALFQMPDFHRRKWNTRLNKGCYAFSFITGVTTQNFRIPHY
jgi:hypothetical protein